LAPELGAQRFRHLRAVLPHLATAAAAIALSLAIQVALPRPVEQIVVTPPTPAQPVPATQPPTPPAATAPPLAPGISAQIVTDLRAEDSRLWGAIYLSRALSQISDAEAALRANDLPTVDQTLLAVDESLALAYARADSAGSDPIDQLRREAGTMREDLYLRPEGMDARLARLRQTILALIEAGG
jgi:hypothetical protein